MNVGSMSKMYIASCMLSKKVVPWHHALSGYATVDEPEMEITSAATSYISKVGLKT